MPRRSHNPSFLCKQLLHEPAEPHPHFVSFTPETKYHGEKLLCKSLEYGLSAEEKWWLKLPKNFENGGSLSDEDVCEVVEAMNLESWRKLCHSLEMKMEETDAKEDTLENLKIWRQMMGSDARRHLLYHLRRLEMTKAVKKIEAKPLREYQREPLKG